MGFKAHDGYMLLCRDNARCGEASPAYPKTGQILSFQIAALAGKLFSKMLPASRQSFFFTYRYWFPVAAPVAYVHLRI
jgi:hypothetical protein